MSDQQLGLNLLTEPDIMMLVRWKAQRTAKGLPKKENPTGGVRSCEEADILRAVGIFEDFMPIVESLGADREEVFRDLLRLRGRGLVVDYGPDLWMLVEQQAEVPA